jgi:cytochrome c oxidase subunit III
MAEIDPYWSSRPDPHDPRQPSFRISTEQLGMIVLFVSLTMIFAASIVAYLITRSQNETWLQTSAGLPRGLWISTLLIFGTSATMQRALGHVRGNRLSAMLRNLRWAALLALGFLACQTLNWNEVRTAQLAVARPTLYAFTFYMLTGLHALHVLGGLLPLGLVLSRAAARQYSSSRYAPVSFLVQYWHFLGLIWIVLLFTMYLAT